MKSENYKLAYQIEKLYEKSKINSLDLKSKFRLYKEINYVNKNNTSYSEECINKMIEQYKDKKFNVYCGKDVNISEFNDESDYKDKTIYGEISNLRKENDYLICDLEFNKDKLKNIYGKCYLDSIYLASPTYENNICKVNECEIGVHYFQELNDDNKPASEFTEIINLEYMKNKAKVEEILETKPTKEQIFNSVTLDKSYYEKSCKQQIELAKEQEKERNKLKPTNELYNMKFDI